MKRAWILLALALLGIAFAGITAVYESRPVTREGWTSAQPKPPWADYIAGAGVVEAGTRNISVGTPVSGIVEQIYVKVGDRVKAGDRLFRIDERNLQAQLVAARADVDQAKAALLTPTHHLANAKHLLKHDATAVSRQDLSDMRDAVKQARANLEVARARVTQLQSEIGLHTVKAPVDGEILQLNMRPGEYMQSSSTSPVMLLLGGEKNRHVRVDVDEYDAWRYRPGAKAVAFVRGHPELRIPLHFAYVEPHMVPKTSLTGLGTERTDTRVLQVIYSFGKPDFSVYNGQQLDVYIQAPPAHDRAGGK